MIRKQSIPLFLTLIIFLVFIYGCTNKEDVSTPSNQQGGQGKTMISSQSPSSNDVSKIIIINNFEFNPSEITIASGTKIKWVNQDSTTHTIKSSIVNSPSIGSGQSFEYKFDIPGTYDYVCGIHPSMKGRIIVK